MKMKGMGIEGSTAMQFYARAEIEAVGERRFWAGWDELSWIPLTAIGFCSGWHHVEYRKAMQNGRYRTIPFDGILYEASNPRERPVFPCR